jgi:hypothetical protein
MDHRPKLFLAAADGRLIGGYRSGRKRVRGTSDISSTASTRSAGTLPRASQPEMDPCDRSPSNLANSVCPPTALQASSSASLLMSLINAHGGNCVNASGGNALGHHRRMSRKAETEPCDFWKRLTQAWAEQGLPVSQYGLAGELGMKGNGSTKRWHDGDALPELATLKVLAEKGDCTLDWLLTGRLPKHPIRPNTPLGMIHNGWTSIGEIGQKHVLEAYEGQSARVRELQQKQSKTKAGG